MVATRKENASNNGSVSPTPPPPSTRMICLPDDDRIDPRLVRDQRAAEDEMLRTLATEILVRKTRPSNCTTADDAAISKLVIWLRAMLLGPALPLNKRTNFVGDILRCSELMADVEIYYETLVVHGGDVASIVERNRADITKRSVYPDPQSTLRVREDVVRNKCIAMVTHFANSRNDVVRIDDAAIERGVEYFYDYYIHSLTSDIAYPKATYNTYTGMVALTMDDKFLTDSEDIVSYGLGMTSVPPRSLVSVTYAPPPYHAILVYILTSCACIYNLPTLHSIDQYATIATFTHGGPLGLSPLQLSSIRLSFATLSIVVTMYKMQNGRPFKIVRLTGSKLPGGTVDMLGWRTQGFYTSWAWNLLGMAFFLGGLIPLLIVVRRHDSGMMMITGKEEEKIWINPWLPRLALVTFEIAAPSAFLTSFIVTYGLWPQAYKQHGPSGTVGFKGPINLIQHNGNIAMVLFEVLLMSGLPVLLGHIVFAILFGLLYIAFIWFMIHRWSPKKGPVFPYFFLDTTLGIRTTLFMVLLMTVMGIFFILFALLDKCIAMIEERDYGVVPNLCCIALVSFILMKFKD